MTFKTGSMDATKGRTVQWIEQLRLLHKVSGETVYHLFIDDTYHQSVEPILKYFQNGWGRGPKRNSEILQQRQDRNLTKTLQDSLGVEPGPNAEPSVLSLPETSQKPSLKCFGIPSLLGYKPLPGCLHLTCGCSYPKTSSAALPSFGCNMLVCIFSSSPYRWHPWPGGCVYATDD